jgi:16S rRNA (uracil1498-N3)-methyltransferase
MAIARFYLSQIPTEDVAELPPEEAAHAKVLRIDVSDSICVFDGQGNEAICHVESVTKRELTYRIVSRRHFTGCLPGKVVLGVSMPKGDRQRTVIEKAVELGVHQLIPIRTERSVAEVNDKAMTRAERIVIEACKQCGRNQLMEVSQAMDFAGFLKAAPPSSSTARWIAHPDQNANLSKSALEFEGNELWMGVGPEGGFSDEEVQLATQAGWSKLYLGDRILRVETAVASVATLAGFLLSPPRVTL